MQNSLESFAGIRAWNASYRHHHLPKWFKLALSQAQPDRNRWRTHGPELPGAVFDHWGSVEIDGHAERAVYAMPYGSPTAAAQAFADAHGMTMLEPISPGPWNPATTLFLFTPKP